MLRQVGGGKKEQVEMRGLSENDEVRVERSEKKREEKRPIYKYTHQLTNWTLKCFCLL